VFLRRRCLRYNDEGGEDEDSRVKVMNDDSMIAVNWSLSVRSSRSFKFEIN
jgi:hypothetical protein